MLEVDTALQITMLGKMQSILPSILLGCSSKLNRQSRFNLEQFSNSAK